MSLSPREVEDSVVYQIAALAGVAAAQGARLRHVKPHGALYNMAARDRALADAVARAVAAVDRSLIVVGLASSALIEAARNAGLGAASEVFADRGYRADGTLMPRHVPGSVLDDAAVIAARAMTMVQQRSVVADDGARVSLDVDTICIHGDTRGAASVAHAVRAALEAAGVVVKALRVD